jgi:3-oxoacyl-(acyl-carrier-protein) synthase
VNQVAGLQLHGTGTSLGDPIEVGAVVSLVLDGRPKLQPLSFLASKASLGHAEPASGIMGLVQLHQVGCTAGVPACCSWTLPRHSAEAAWEPINVAASCRRRWLDRWPTPCCT